ncbi:MAG: methionine gamma-lyase family protein [Clostridia bacterium]|nr:methionine gamma-lyase family protein [Clostridia bacterium]MBR5367047.1 methionine gamma-lyase family protein [Clostridia bacterium]
MHISSSIREKTARAEEILAPIFSDIDRIARENTEHVLDCFREAQVSEALFAPSTGYGYGDVGRDRIDALAAAVFLAPAGFMRPSLLSGTHTLTVALFGILRPGDTMLSVSGVPYDTILPVIGIDADGSPAPDGEGSLADWGVAFRSVALTADPADPLDFPAIREAMRTAGERLKMVYVQRSKGYADRPTLTARQIRHAAYCVKQFAAELGIRPPVFMVDNCYGEFTETAEPTFADPNRPDETGADLIAGSLIKNPGGGMADVGGYIVGHAECVRLCGSRLTSPGVGLDVGASLGQNRNLIKGLFYAPHTVAQAMKTAHLAAYLFAELGCRVTPAWDERRSDIVQCVECGSPAGLAAFCRGIQSASPIDAHVTPEAWDMPGYADPVIMAAGAFTGGASIELSADGPMRAPYTAFMQGGLTYESARLAVMSAAEQFTRRQEN